MRYKYHSFVPLSTIYTCDQLVENGGKIVLHEGPDGTLWIGQGLNITAHGHLLGRCEQGIHIGFTCNKGER